MKMTYNAPRKTTRIYSQRFFLCLAACSITINSFAATVSQSKGAKPLTQAPVNVQSGGSSPVQLAPRQVFSKQLLPTLSAGASVAYVVVKFKEDLTVERRNNDFALVNGSRLNVINDIVRPYASDRISGLFRRPASSLKRVRESLSQARGRQLATLENYYQIAVTDPSEAQDLVTRLNKRNEVEIAYAMPVPEEAGDIAPPTPSYVASQDYLEPAPGGVNALFAQTQPGGDGSGVKIIDIEIAWNQTHEDLDAAALAFVAITSSSTDVNHGTAVLGEMIGGANGYGVTGICPGAQVGMISVAVLSIAEALYTTADYLDPGDAVLIELHSPGPHFNFEVRQDQKGYVCMEYFPAEYDAIQYLWARGIVVVEAAGNGAENFNDAGLYGQLFDTTYRNSHAIIVGAGYPAVSASDRTRLSFSNYGTRVNLQGYGSGVYTTGYGDLFNPGNDINQRYTSSFSGTSSASPIVTGSVVDLQGRYKFLNGSVMTSDMIRDILVATGSAQTGNISEHIGPRPNLLAAFAALPTPPSLYADPIYLDTTQDLGDIGASTVVLHNRSGANTLNYVIAAEDSLALATVDWLQASPSSGSIPANDSALLTVTLDGSSLTDRIAPYSGVIKVNWGPSPGPTDSQTVVPVYLTIPCMDTTYHAISSDSAGGPTYSWIDITTSGVKIPAANFYNTASNPLDDGTAGPFFLQMDFPFFGVNYSNVWIGVNGAISFTDTAVNSNGFFDAFNVPLSPLNTFVSAFWNDLTMDVPGGGHGDIYVKGYTNDKFVITWNRMGNFNSTADTMTTFQIILYRNGNIVMQHQNVGSTGLDTSAVVGVEEQECDYEAYYSATGPLDFIPQNNSAVLFKYTTPVYVMSGDADNSTDINIGDVTYLIAYIFSGGPAPVPLAAGDVDCSSDINISDVTYLISYIFSSGPSPCLYAI